jgi:transposase
MVQNTKFYMGIDVSKHYFDLSLLKVIAHVKQTTITERFDNTRAGIKSLHKWLKGQSVSFNENSLLVIENTGVYHRLLWAYCSKYNLPIHIGNGAHIKWSFGIARGKNDVIDSQRLCSYACKHADELKATPVLNPVFLKLKDLLSARSKLVSQLQSIKKYLNELSLSNDASVQRLIERAHKAALDGLKKSIAAIEDQLQTILKEDQQINTNYKLLLTIPGIGHLTALYIICCTNNFIRKVSGKQLASYAGVVPFEHKSGTSIKGRNRVHKMANKELKCMLHLCALTAIRQYPEFKHYFDRKRSEGKHSMSVLNAIKNKIVLRVAAVVNKQQPYATAFLQAA